MHFSKTYAQLLLTLPPDLRENAIQYRQLKKVINQVVQELSSLGLDPTHLNELLQAPGQSLLNKGKGRASLLSESETDLQGSEATSSVPSSSPRCVYEITSSANHLQPRLRLWIAASGTEIAERRLVYDNGAGQCNSLRGSVEEGTQDVASGTPDIRDILRTSAHIHPLELEDGLSWHISRTSNISTTRSIGHGAEVVIPLNSDRIFFDLLVTALQSLSIHLQSLQSEFIVSLQGLSRDIASSALPLSSTNDFRPYSHASDPTAVHVPSLSHALRKTGFHSDLYAWREFFQLYTEMEIFESTSERSRGERTVEESEERLQTFLHRMQERGFYSKHRWRLKGSRNALKAFLQLNHFLMNLKKLQHANSEAIRKILKKHTKRTALPLPSIPSLEGDTASSALSLSLPVSMLTPSEFMAGLLGSAASLPRMLVQAIGETLLPIIPHVDDYACPICTSIAFKPIRLQCSHLFCVRCLVKMQKRSKANCPVCRAPTVLLADRSNVDWALLNFMKDWFPIESKAKLQQNEREASQEELEELGLDVRGCVIS